MSAIAPEHDAAVRALHERYFNALDRRDFTAIGDCFTRDAVAVYLGGAWQLDGRARILETLEAILAFDSTIHAPATISLAREDDAVTSETFAIAHIAHTSEGARRMMIRGLRYRDRCVLDDGAWRIAHRRQDPLWQYEVDGVEPSIPQQRA